MLTKAIYNYTLPLPYNMLRGRKLPDCKAELAQKYAALEPPVKRSLVVILAVLLLLQVREDAAPGMAEVSWRGEQGLRMLYETYQLIRSRYDNPPDDRQLWEGAVDGMMKRLPDPYSRYDPPRISSLLQNEMEDGLRGGIGVKLVPGGGKGLCVISVMRDLPAGKAGLQPGDLITAVDGQDVCTIEFTAGVDLIGGEVGSEVRLTVTRGGEVKQFAVRREELPHYCLLPSGMVDVERGIGLLTVAAFTMETAATVKAEVERLRGQGMRALVIDLRWNGGGVLQAGVETADLFLGKGTIATALERKPEERPGNYYRETYRADAQTVGDFPIAILCGGATASAAELFTAALRDNGRAKAVGMRTYGKSRIQSVVLLSRTGASLCLTVGKYLTPRGEDIQGRGLEPDFKVELDREGLEKVGRACDKVWSGGAAAELLREDAQLARAVEYLREELAK